MADKLTLTEQDIIKYRVTRDYVDFKIKGQSIIAFIGTLINKENPEAGAKYDPEAPGAWSQKKASKILKSIVKKIDNKTPADEYTSDEAKYMHKCIDRFYHIRTRFAGVPCEWDHENDTPIKPTLSSRDRLGR